MPSPSTVARSAVSYARPSVPKPSLAHSAPIAVRPPRASSTRTPPSDEAVLEPELAAEALEQRVVFPDTHAGVSAREDP